MKNVFVEDCFLDSARLDTAFRVKNNAMRGGTLEDFHIRNVRVGRVAKQVKNFFFQNIFLEVLNFDASDSR